MAFAIEPKSQGRRGQGVRSLRRLQEEDPTIDLHRDPQTGEQIVAGLSQVHVEVIVRAAAERFGVEVTLKPPRVPYQETIRVAGRGARAPQEAVRRPRPVRRLPHRDRAAARAAPTSSSSTTSRAARSRGQFIPAVEKGVREAMEAGVLAGYPVKGVRVTLVDGSYHAVDSSELAFKLAGSIAMKQALENASPVLLEPIMLVTLSVPEETVGDVIGDLNSGADARRAWSRSARWRRSRRRCRWPSCSATRPTCGRSPAARATTRWSSSRYEEVPSQIAQRVIDMRRSPTGGGSALTQGCGKRAAHGSSCTPALIT